jgi:hypothetical protein
MKGENCACFLYPKKTVLRGEHTIMVVCLNNNTMQYYQPKIDNSVQENLEIAPEELPPPLAEQARVVLRERLRFTSNAKQHTYWLDGRMASLKEVVEAVNRHIRAVGGQFLAYPGVRPLYYGDGAVMHIKNI